MDDVNNWTLVNSVSSMSRSLGGGGGPVELDYTVFAMAVLTMGLLLIVEVIRQGIDRMAQGHDFFETVLKTVYHELSTLGIVEATIFLLNQFLEVNLQKEKIFADVHFTLFFVAIINALMACVIYILAMIVAHRRWVKMETLDFNHYVAIRQEFDQVEAQLKQNKKRMEAKQAFSNHTTETSSLERDSSLPNYDKNNNNGSNEQNQQDDVVNKDKNLLSVIGAIIEKPNAPKLGHYGTYKAILERKYSDLLVQIRFHDMRVHFIEKHKLPNNFRISAYLTLAMNDAFKDFVHVSTRTWLALMACANFIYFMMGIVTYATSSASSSSYENNQFVSQTLSWIFICYSMFFIVISFLISIKMEAIFRRIIGKDSWVPSDSSLISKSSFFGRSLIGPSWSFSKGSLDANNKSQKDQFWLAKPDLIITFAQLMQFGFSVGFAILLVFRKTVRAGNVFKWWGWYFVAPMICFLIFIWLWSVIIPLYTQCTNLGELVSKRHIIEIEAISQLEEERNRRQEHIDYLNAEKDVSENMRKRMKIKSKDRVKRVRIRSISAQSFGDLFSDETLEQISEFVKKPTKDLPRRSRNTSVSDGTVDSFFASPTDQEGKPKKQIEEGENNTSHSSVSIETKARNLFLSNGYKQASAVFGTLIALYLLALHIQLMLVRICEMRDLDVIWYFTLKEPHQVFWLVIGWFCAFVIESLIILLLFTREKGRKNFFMVVAGCLDILITCASTGIFLVAEYNRCCGCNSDSSEDFTATHSNIFRASTDNVAAGVDTTSSLCVIDAELSCCPSFGSRLCGGVGTIEPFTALISLRLFRFFAANYIVRPDDSNDGIEDGHSNDGYIEEDLFFRTGTIAELWIVALTQYTDIVKRHGIFSSNLLESMLGIEPMPEMKGKAEKLIEENLGSFSKRDALTTSERSVTLERPNSQLIRSVRRCAFKWFPLLNDKWQMVDVALTEHEIVWFDAKVNLLHLGDDEKDAVYAMKERMRETKGGKDLRLNEVALGRTILGRLSLSALEQVIVQKIPQEKDLVDESDQTYCDVEKMRENSIVNSEYWASSSLQQDLSISFDDEIENFFDVHNYTKRLKIRSNYGTLYLRFIADNKVSGAENLQKDDISLLWCQTIVHLKGQKGLKQNLPNFGSKDEWKDLIETVNRKDLDRDDNEGKMSTQNLFQRIASGKFTSQRL